jgi:hypothetical protein
MRYTSESPTAFGERLAVPADDGSSELSHVTLNCALNGEFHPGADLLPTI